jgi:hypothetical protein
LYCLCLYQSMLEFLRQSTTPIVAPEPMTDDEIFAAFKARVAEKQESQKTAFEESLAGLPDDIANEKRRQRTVISQMAAEHDAQNRRLGYASRSTPRGSDYSITNVLRAAAPFLTLAAAGVAWMGAIGITEANYDSSQASQYMREEGYTNVHDPERHTLLFQSRGCGRGDLIDFEFEVTAPNGDEVKRIVCKGLTGAAVIREG